MNREHTRLSRLRRLERIRDIARQAAAGEAADAENALAKLRRISDRTRLLAEDYASPHGLDDGAALANFAGFSAQLATLSDRAVRDADAAQVHADAKLAELACAERRRAAVGERADRQARLLAKPAYEAASASRRGLGTKLDTGPGL